MTTSGSGAPAAGAALCLFVALSAGGIPGCARPDPAMVSDPPPSLLGSFRDDYGARYTITEDLWVHGALSRYRIRTWHPESRYLIAQNAETNPTDGGLWTRIDWIEIADMPPWEWAFCMTEYRAESAEAAEAASGAADPSSPRDGCNGFPYSRMAREEPGP